MSAVSPLGLRLRAGISCAALVVVGGCATFGGNVKGSFSCSAPDGVCAPTSSIDDRALAMIAGDGGEVTPAGPYREQGTRAKASGTTAVEQRLPLRPVDPSRTQERVLRIVFQPYIDERGRLHEASAVHAVVQGGEWQQQVQASATAIPDRNASAQAAQSVSLAEAVERADPPGGVIAASDPNLPDPAVVAAARARRDDPVEAIKSEVAARLAPKAGRTPPAPSNHAAPAPNPAARAVVAPTPGSASTDPKPSAEAGTVSTSPPKTVSDSAAAARVKGDPRFQARADEVESSAKSAEAEAVLPDAKPVSQPTVRAAGFPAVVPEDN